MSDIPLIILIRSVLLAGFAARGMTVSVLQSNQPTHQGLMATGPSVYIYKIGDHRHGTPLKKDTWNSTTQLESHVEREVIESTYQFTALAPLDPSSLTQLTASDIARAAASILQHSTSQSTFSASNVGILRITDIRNPYFVDDQDQFKQSPSFDLVLTHEEEYTSTVPHAVTIEPGIHRV